MGGIKEVGKVFKAIIKETPLLGTLLGGPLGGKIGPLVSAALGADINDEDAALKKLQDPQAILALKQLEADHKEELIRLQIEETKLYIGDAQNARTREVSVVQATKSKDWYLYGLATVIVLGFFTTIIVFMRYPVPISSKDVVNTMIGFLGGAFAGVVGYFFGSSKSSADKTQILANGNNSK